MCVLIGSLGNGGYSQTPHEALWKFRYEKTVQKYRNVCAYHRKRNIYIKTDLPTLKQKVIRARGFGELG